MPPTPPPHPRAVFSHSLITSATSPLVEAKTNMKMTTVSNSAIFCVASTGRRQTEALLTVKMEMVQGAKMVLVLVKGGAGVEITRRPTH